MAQAALQLGIGLWAFILACLTHMPERVSSGTGIFVRYSSEHVAELPRRFRHVVFAVAPPKALGFCDPQGLGDIFVEAHLAGPRQRGNLML